MSPTAGRDGRPARARASSPKATATDTTAASAGSPTVAGENRRLVVGLVKGFHGLDGTIRLEELSDRADRRFAVGRTLYAEGDDAPLTIVFAQPAELGWRVRFAELRDRTAAETLRDKYLEADVGPGDELARGEYYWHEVIGAAVSDVNGRVLGRVADIYRAGGAEVLLVHGGARELDIPVVRPFVRIFAPRRGEIVVDAAALGLEETAPDEGAAGAGPGEEDAGGPAADA